MNIKHNTTRIHVNVLLLQHQLHRDDETSTFYSTKEHNMNAWADITFDVY